MLNPVLLKTYNELFDQAEEAVAGDTVLLLPRTIIPPPAAIFRTRDRPYTGRYR